MICASSVDGIPRLPVGDWVESAFEWINSVLGGFFDILKSIGQAAISGLTDLLTGPPALVVAVALSLLAFALSRRWKLGVGSLIGLVLIVGMDQWEASMATLALVLVATVIALLLAVPIGIGATRSEKVSTLVRPVLDLMQTMPAFVWLVPVVTMFSIGAVAGVVATVIFALPPGVRLTELGIRQVDAEVVEAGHAFGAHPREILREIQLPLAMPTIMAGVNQVIMLALSMAVIAGLVGAGGLGSQVTTSIARLDIGLGFEAGFSVVILAVYLDRLTSAIGRGAGGSRSGGRRRRATVTDDAPAPGRPHDREALTPAQPRRDHSMEGTE